MITPAQAAFAAWLDVQDFVLLKASPTYDLLLQVWLAAYAQGQAAERELAITKLETLRALYVCQQDVAGFQVAAKALDLVRAPAEESARAEGGT